jgi:2-polyprenyl-3-methyl-5-hydroxy-6-metoxy-1,4-benzoquinol methylase
VHSLLENAGCAGEDVRVHCTPGVTEAFKLRLTQLGITPVEIDTFPGHPYCNKIQQCFSGAFDGYDKVVLTDCDLFFLSKPAVSPEARFAGKVVDLPNPPLDVLQAIYNEAGVSPRGAVPVSCALAPQEQTYTSNLNGGFYVLDRSDLGLLGERWKTRAQWLLERPHLLGRSAMHVDQIALALALDELGIAVTPLKAEYNFPVHLPKERLEAMHPNGIACIHYHSHVLPGGAIKETGVAAVDRAVRIANGHIERIVGQHFDNALFWNWRYACFPELGSGIGSRGEILEYKRQLLSIALAPFRDARVLDIGCGDLETTKNLPLRHYTGADVSESALEIARRKRPEWQFIHATPDAIARESADAVLCLDVLIHQKTAAEYHNTLAALVAATGQRLIVSGFDGPPSLTSNITGYHEPLSASLRRFGVFNEILCIGKYRDVSLFVADKTPSGPNRHISDIPRNVFDVMAPLAPRPDLLLELMDESRRSFGFFTQTSIRALEYPWMVEQIAARGQGQKVLDIGAGVSPLPVVLARRGMRVDCVDAHPIVHNAHTRATWNEWGFFDYSTIHGGMRAFHQDILQFQPDEPYDVVYSLSVVEHMPRRVWERTIELSASWIKPGGRVILTVDVIPNTMDLWNMSEGKVVEPAGVHGTIEDLGKKMMAAGLHIEEATIRRSIPFSRTDVAFFVARRP